MKAEVHPSRIIVLHLQDDLENFTDQIITGSYWIIHVSALKKLKLHIYAKHLLCLLSF